MSYRKALIEDLIKLLTGIHGSFDHGHEPENCECKVALEIQRAKRYLSVPEAEQALAQEPGGEGFSEILRSVLPVCINCGKITATYVCDEGPVCGKECMSELDDMAADYEYETDARVKRAIDLLEGRREGQHARMTEVEALAEARKRFGKSCRIVVNGFGNFDEIIYIVKDYANKKQYEGVSWEAAFKAADKERCGE